MSMARHDQLIDAGWKYHPNVDRYSAPGSDRLYNLDAAWAAEQRRKASAMPARGIRRDPRQQEPE